MGLLHHLRHECGDSIHLTIIISNPAGTKFPHWGIRTAIPTNLKQIDLPPTCVHVKDGIRVELHVTGNDVDTVTVQGLN